GWTNRQQPLLQRMWRQRLPHGGSWRAELRRDPGGPAGACRRHCCNPHARPHVVRLSHRQIQINGHSTLRSSIMTTIQVFDPAMCCNTGVCGVAVDQSLVTFAADVDWAQQNGAQIERFNLSQHLMAFEESAIVKGLLERTGQTVLPVTLVDGQLALAGRYPSRDDLARWAGLQPQPSETKEAASCCSGSRCC